MTTIFALLILFGGMAVLPFLIWLTGSPWASAADDEDTP